MTDPAPEPNYGRRKTDVPYIETRVASEPTRFAAVYANAFEAAIAIAAVVSALVFFLDPSAQTAIVVRQLGNAAWVWNALYLGGGAGVIIGLGLHGTIVRFRGRVLGGDGRVELAGLIMLMTAVLVNAIAILSKAGFTSPSAATFTALIFACLLRIRVILTQRKAVYPIAVPAKE